VATKRVIAHLDCDAFYATVELLRRPDLAGKPVIVAGAGPRSVVTTASYEARAFGVGSAMPASQARRLCPTAIVIPPDFGAYREKSRDVWAIVRGRLNAVQSMGLDEAYADLTGVEKPLRVLREVVERVRKETGIQISVGVGPSRLVAKCCSDLGKPAGFVAMGREEACIRFAPAPTRRLPGIGPKTAERLAELGYATVGQLQEADEAQLAARFGDRWARYLKARANFHDDSLVETESGEGLAKKGRRGRTVAIKVRLADWTTVTRAKTLDGSTNDVALVTDTAVGLLRAYAPPQPVRLLGVRLASFDDVEPDRPPAPVAPVGQLALPL
jgi:DNA polymerase-4